jgi:phosphatidylethanolamine/phosphatidyl-N-methylethanolamine N-methyltransferase
MKKKNITSVLAACLISGSFIFYTNATFSAPQPKRSHVAFMVGLIKDPSTVGALAPSSSYVAQELAQPLSAHAGPRRILEIGAGTGQITDTLVTKITDQDTLDVVELNKDFCTILSNKYANYTNVTVFSGSILDWNPEQPYDFIICTLPFNRFPYSLVEKIIMHAHDLIAPGGTFSYIELKYLGYFKQLFLSRDELKEFTLVRAYMKQFNQQCCYQKTTVLRNFPPAEVYHCQLKG